MSLVVRALDTLKDVNASNYDKVPPLHRLCWRLGILIPPPMLAGFWFNAGLLGVFFAVTWGAIMTFFFPLVLGIPTGRTLPVMAVAALGAGVFFGLTMAIIARRKAASHDLPSWQSLLDAERKAG